MSRYEVRDIISLDEKGGYYFRHVDAMTGEKLHSKSDIAAELGHRDMLIDTYRDLCGELLEELRETHAGLCFTKDYIGTLRYDRNKAAITKAEAVMGEKSNG